MRTRRSRPIHLLFLSVLLGAASLFVCLTLVGAVSFLVFFADHLAALYRPPLLVIVLESPGASWWICDGGSLVSSGMGVSSGPDAGGLCTGVRSPLAGAFLLLGSF
jgi:hypothetical protein